MTYPGGKGGAGVAETIINQQPPHRTYIEPFLGSAAVMRRKKPAANNIGYDLDAVLVHRAALAMTGDYLFYTGDGLKAIRAEQHTQDTLIYCDPPYPFDARQRHRRIYKHEMSIDQHVELLATLRMLPCMIQLSSYNHPMYSEMLRGWRCVTFTAMTRGGPATEYLWMNYPPPQALHDYRYLGDGFRERERIKRKTARMLARLAKLPELERLALSSAMAEAVAAGSQRRVTTP
jgi:DNA adenine methylase